MPTQKYEIMARMNASRKLNGASVRSNAMYDDLESYNSALLCLKRVERSRKHEGSVTAADSMSTMKQWRKMYPFLTKYSMIGK